MTDPSTDLRRHLSGTYLRAGGASRCLFLAAADAWEQACGHQRSCSRPPVGGERTSPVGVGSRARHIHREGRLLSWRLWHCSLRSRHGGGSGGGFRDGGTPGVELGLKLVQARERKCRVAVSGSL